jgi:phenazine biosynthesis protein phzE
MNGLEHVLNAPAYAFIKVQGSDDVIVVCGGWTDHERLGDIPLESGVPAGGERYDHLVCVPYAQIRERGFVAIDDGTPLRAIRVEREERIPLAELVERLPQAEMTTVGRHGFDITDDDYARLVDRVIREEIGNGEGANLVIARSYRARLAAWDSARALSCLRRLLTSEQGAYWTYLVYTGDRYLLGASPERHVSVRDGQAWMNPISGTFPVGADDGHRKGRLLDFLADEKEIYELFMVVDEELKMMCDICASGGTILGPYLKPMTHLIHTEYVLAGRTELDVREVLRRSMWAATVTGSPVENACRLIAEYEPAGRGYYAAVLALIGRDASGVPTLDAPILLRTADVSPAGELRVGAGATLVRDSDPVHEVAETHAKAGGVLTAFGLVEPPRSTAAEIAHLAADPGVRAALVRRNDRLSPFWFDDQSSASTDPSLVGRHVVVLDGEDDFCAMLMHVLGVLGMTSERLRHDDYRTGDFDRADLAVVGPGPGDPRDLADPRIAAVRRAVDDLLGSGRPFLAVCLGHQVLCAALGFPLAYKDIVFQGTQTAVRLRLSAPAVGDGAALGEVEAGGTAATVDRSTVDARTAAPPESEHLVGFYNTFVARLPREAGAGRTANGSDGRDTAVPGSAVVDPRVRHVDADPMTGDIHHVSGDHFDGIQFHAESILSEDGVAVLRTLVRALVSRDLDLAQLGRITTS